MFAGTTCSGANLTKEPLGGVVDPVGFIVAVPAEGTLARHHGSPGSFGMLYACLAMLSKAIRIARGSTQD